MRSSTAHQKDYRAVTLHFTALVFQLFLRYFPCVQFYSVYVEGMCGYSFSVHNNDRWSDDW